jgi:hypothetical protein
LYYLVYHSFTYQGYFSINIYLDLMSKLTKFSTFQLFMIVYLNI